MTRRVAVGHRSCELALVVALVREPDREGSDRLSRDLRHLRDDDRRVEPAREQRAEWHVRHEPLPNGGGHGLSDPFDPLVVGGLRLAGGGLPVALGRDAFAFDDEQ